MHPGPGVKQLAAIIMALSLFAVACEKKNGKPANSNQQTTEAAAEPDKAAPTATAKTPDEVKPATDEAVEGDGDEEADTEDDSAGETDDGDGDEEGGW
jgi:hypothetical protein